MLKKTASGVLASLRGSTLKKSFRRSETLVELLRSPRSIIWVNGHTKCGLYLLASSLGAALPGTRRVSARQGWADEKFGHFEHPETFYISVTEGKFRRCFVCQLSFSAIW
jgi:hypothetical protein